MSRPTFIDLSSKANGSSESLPGFLSTRAAHPSPRMQHLAGDIPPAMSPLDMFAAQSRLLAKQLDDSKRDGRRVSRLPPLSTADPITKQKSMYDRARSAEAARLPPAQSSPKPREREESGTMPEVEEPQFRPQSFYPRMSHIPPEEDEIDDLEDQPFMTPVETNAARQHDYFGATQSKSPDTALPRDVLPETNDRSSWVFPPRIHNTSQPFGEPQRGLSIESASSKSYTSSLVPPGQDPMRSTNARHAPSVRSIPQDSSDDDLSASTGESGFSQPRRKLSSSSNVSMPQSPFSTYAHATHGRSPSLNSEYSLSGSRQPRPAFNFSRPLSRASRPSMDLNGRQPSFENQPSIDFIRPPFASLSRQHSNDSQQSRVVFDTNERVATPGSTDHEHSPESMDMPTSSYVYTKYSLPRGRVVQRDPKVLENKDMPLYEGDRPVLQSNVQHIGSATPLPNRTMSPRSSSHYSPPSGVEQQYGSARPSFEHRPHSSPRPSMEQTFKVRTSTEQQSNLNPNRRPSAVTPTSDRRPSITPVTGDDQSEYSASTRSGSTIKASSRSQKPTPSTEVTAEDHLAKGISLHERGEIKESTYHLRIAAKANLPTAMLLYALACRHGWGMRPNPQDGVMWLRKAADCASLEIATSDDDGNNGGDAVGRKTRRAQFAYAIYELGISHMNGLGIEQDKTLALRCFEIAANWGDVDAMAEAGFCYAEGQGCKKDLRKAARYYKMAEARGMSMVGNSWYAPSLLRIIAHELQLTHVNRIHKAKYNDVDDKPHENSDRGRGAGKVGVPEKEKKSRDKSRTRTIFGGRKKSVSQPRP